MLKTMQRLFEAVRSAAEYVPAGARKPKRRNSVGNSCDPETGSICGLKSAILMPSMFCQKPQKLVAVTAVKAVATVMRIRSREFCGVLDRTRWLDGWKPARPLVETAHMSAG